MTEVFTSPEFWKWSCIVLLILLVIVCIMLCSLVQVLGDIGESLIKSWTGVLWGDRKGKR